MNDDSILELQQVGLTASLGKNYLLKDISFGVNLGDRIAIIGSSGAGKTTLLRLLNRLSEPTEGQIFYNHQPIQKIPIISLRQQIVLVPQEPKLLGMTVQETLVYPLVLQKRSKQEISDRINTWINRLLIPYEWLERNELQLSLGQRQIISIARGLIMQPQILLLDEPTSALDLGMANHLIDVLKELTEQKIMSILMVNHQLEITEKFAQKVLYLQGGKLESQISYPDINWQVIREKLMKTQQDRLDEWGE
ncbi:cobalt ABC transporter [Aphanothece hegewaldii CCALA 016]|uniref:Cobalt ABC transporter n=1 Tax=Aphanothece hegewaldii CCALA 016 TaxID=2107694 RepID=A0A2T1LZ96_9CHRO|nr:ATP-binding cassette domain-containing protein [Aphanothece hegewaldii]PSF37717.1 cobalt ABC transporter [Aphanothece hegewaldii CCALA 016]